MPYFQEKKKLPDAIFFGVFSVSQFVLVIFRSLNSIHIGLFDASFTFSFFFFILSDVIDFSLNKRQYYPLTSHLIQGLIMKIKIMII